MNSTLKHNANVSLSNISNQKATFELEYVDTRTFKIKPKELSDGRKLIRFWNNDRLYQTDREFILSIDKDIADNTQPQVETFYLLWGIVNPASSTITKFILTKQPKAISNASVTYTKGSQVTVTLPASIEHSAYQFTEGSRVIVWQSEDAVGGASEKANLGTILSIATNTLTLQMDNNINYGTSWNSGGASVYIVQLNNFQPLKLYNHTSEVISQNYTLLTAGIYLKVNDDWGYAELKSFNYTNGFWTGHEYDLWYGAGSSTHYNRWVYPFYALPPTARYFIGQNRFDMSYSIPSPIQNNYAIVEFWIKDKNLIIQYRDLYGLSPYNQAYYWHQGSIYGNLNELIFKYEEQAWFTEYSEMALRICRIHGFKEEL